MSNTPDDSEEFRLCPTCRMSISVWATKCRYCGESVGRPKKEESHFTIKDLGGQPQKVYTLSGNVTDALESFRVEEASVSQDEKSVQAERRKSFLRKMLDKDAKTSSGAQREEPGLPELDEYHRSLTSSTFDRAVSGRRRPQGEQPDILRRLFSLGGIVAALVLLGLGGDYGWDKLSAYLESRNKVEEFVYENRARTMMEQGAPLIDILTETQTAYGYNQTEENAALLEEAQKGFIAEIKGLLAKNPYQKMDHDAASRLMSRAVGNQAGPELLELDKLVRSEMAYYAFTLKAISGDSATFDIKNPEFQNKDLQVKAGDMIQDRFRVDRVTPNYVRLEDTKYPGTERRQIEIKVLGYPEGS
ncbi:MAG: hypothetical protein HYV27_16525 [Candidatus Hydrogenedentes bacterium]|nr:hypothetical protein [Candidatus Hydrogenedentota bacterium]